MQTTLDKFYTKTRGLRDSLGSKFPHKGPAKRLFADDIKSESCDEYHTKDVSPLSTVDCKSKDFTSFSVVDSICSTSTNSAAVVPPLIEESLLDKSIKDDVSKAEIKDEPYVAEISSPSSKCEQNHSVVSKTPSSRLIHGNVCSTPTRSPCTQTVLRKQLRLGEYSRLIQRSKRSQSRKRSIDTADDDCHSPTEIRQSLNDIYASPKLKRFDMVEVEVTSPVKRGLLKPRRLFGPSALSSPKKDTSYVSPSKLLAEGPIRTPQASPRKPSLERVDYLLANGKEALVLPRKYLELEETFHWIERVMKMRSGRKETITFNRIRNDVQKATGRRFTEDHLGKIKAVFPEAFNLSRQLMKVPMSRDKSYELVIEVPNGIHTAEREKTFHNLLIERTKVHHQAFLEQFDPSLQISSSEVRRWHREFNLNNVPDIVPDPVPQRPDDSNTRISAKDLLEKTHIIVSGNKRLERAVSAVSEEHVQKEPPKPVQPESPVTCKKTAALQKALKGISPVLLEKIRAKQTAKLAQDMIRTPAAAREAIMLSRLPEMAKILRVVFVHEKKSILPEEKVIQAVGQSFKEKMPAKDLKEHFELLSKHLPGWINSCKVENKPYIRLSKDADMTRVLGRLQKLIELS